jgi:hypothetical protein
MAKVRHISYRADYVDAMAKFFVDTMGMKMIQKRENNATAQQTIMWEKICIALSSVLPTSSFPKSSAT